MREKSIKEKTRENAAPYATQDELIRDYFSLFELFEEWDKRENENERSDTRPLRDSFRRRLQERERRRAGSEREDPMDAQIDLDEEEMRFRQDEERFLERARKKLEERIAAEEEKLRRRLKASKQRLPRFPLMKVKEKHKLDETEFRVLVLLLRNEMETSSRWGRRTIDEPVRILNLLLKDPFESMRAREYFFPKGKLCKKRLISFEHYRGSFGRSTLSLTEKTVREIFGQPKLKKSDEDMGWDFTHLRSRRGGGETMRVPKITLEQVVLPSNVKEDILRCLSQVRNEKTLFKSWGFSEVIKYGKGVTMLFAGPPGTGKTVTAQAVANHLKKKLMVVNTAQVKSMWHGGTDKNIVATFREAKEKNSVLFFDEADALFYSRMGSTRHSIDVLYNQIINLMLQEIEKFDGVVILATNHSKGMDEALERRITLKVEFETPDAELRAKIWRTLIPANAPLSEDVDFDALAREFDFAGGHIKNAVLNAARFAVSRGEGAFITMNDLREAALGELKGKSLFGRKSNGGRVGFRKAGAA